MSTPRSSMKRRRLSLKLHTPGSTFGLKHRNGEEADQDTNTQNFYTVHPERLHLSVAVGDSDSEDNYEGLEELLNHSWNVFRVSPLHNFEYTTVRLKQYSRRMREGLTTLLTDSTADTHYDVNFSVVEGISLTQNDSKAIKIMVNIMKQKNGEEDRSKYYVGYLVSRGASRPFEEESVIHLPVLLCKGTIRTSSSVHFLVQKFFDCSISALQLSQEDMMWVYALQADESVATKESTQVKMKFTFPQLSVKNSVEFNMSHKSLRRLWKSVHDSSSDSVSYQEVETYCAALKHQLSATYKLNIACGQLVTIKTSTLTITNQTKVSAKTIAAMNLALTILYEGSTILGTSAPTLSIQSG